MFKSSIDASNNGYSQGNCFCKTWTALQYLPIAMGVHAVLVINKAGGLIFDRDFGGIRKLTSNEKLVLAGTLHGYWC